MNNEIVWKIGDICEFGGHRMVVIGSSLNNSMVELRDCNNDEIAVNKEELKPLPIDRDFFEIIGLICINTSEYKNHSVAKALNLTKRANFDGTDIWAVYYNGAMIAAVSYAHELKRIIDALKIPR